MMSLYVVGVAAAAGPTRLRASGSDWASTEPHTRFALTHDTLPHFQWAPHLSGHGSVQAAYEINVSDPVGNVHWRSGKVASTEAHAAYPTSARALLPATTYKWSLATFDQHGTRSPVSSATFHTALSPIDWRDVSWLGDHTSNVYTTTFDANDADGAVLYIAGISFSVVTVNGKVLNTLTTSPWTEFALNNGFSSYDLSGVMLPRSNGDASAKNTIVVYLGNGWRDQGPFRVLDPAYSSLQGAHSRMLRAKLVATHADGRQSILTHTGDGSWSCAAGPSTYDSVYNGEHYDARIAKQLFASGVPSPASKALWRAAQPATGPAGSMVAWSAPPVAVLATVAPVDITTPKPSLFVVDFGERRAGVVRLKQIACGAGSTIVMRHAEILQHAGLPDLNGTVEPGMIYVGNLRTAQQTDVYTCSGEAGGETWAPQLTYHGFRFVEINVTGAAGVTITKPNVEMVHFASAVRQRADTHFSSTTLNKIQAMALGAQRSNMMTIPTDCDQRDERLGWMGDANLSGESMMLNFDVAAFFAWWVRFEGLEALGKDGSLPDVVPFYRFGSRPGDVSWSTALPNVIYQMWKVYGDLDIYRAAKQGVTGQLTNLAAQAAHGLSNLHTPYGDWCPPPAKMGGGRGLKPSRPLTSAFSYIDLVQQAAAMAAAAGETHEAANLTALNHKLLAEYNTAFYRSAGQYDTGTQTALALTLAIGASPAPNTTLHVLLDTIAANQTHAYTGIIGSSKLYPVLGAMGAHDVALAVLQQTSYPSFGFGFANSLEKTTTNLWELPDAPVEGTGMNSRNHHMFSAFSAYLVHSVAGVSQAAGSAGFRELDLRASAAYALHSAATTLELPHGDVHFRWVRSGGVQYDKVAEGDTANLSCGPRGGTIERVVFASFGTPTARAAKSRLAVPRLQAHAACHAASSVDVVAERCVGRASCELVASRRTFGLTDADVARCEEAAGSGLYDKHSEPLRLWVSVECARETAIDAVARVPVGSRATLRLPVRGAVPPVLREGGEVVYARGAVPVKMAEHMRVSRVLDDELGDVLAVRLGSGEYEFALTAQR